MDLPCETPRPSPASLLLYPLLAAISIPSGSGTTDRPVSRFALVWLCRELLAQREAVDGDGGGSGRVGVSDGHGERRGVLTNTAVALVSFSSAVDGQWKGIGHMSGGGRSRMYGLKGPAGRWVGGRKQLEASRGSGCWCGCCMPSPSSWSQPHHRDDGLVVGTVGGE